MRKIVLDLCGATGAWSKDYKNAGYDVRIITLPKYNVIDYFPPDNVYGILAAPPCTMFSLAGNRWRYQEKLNGEYIPKIIEALIIVQGCLRIIKICKPKFWVLENPVGTLSTYLGPPKMTFNPCDYGDPYTKKTALWGDFVPPLPLFIGEDRSVQAEFVTLSSGKRMSKVHYNAFRLPKDKRTEARSITPPGFARAFFEANK